MKLSVIIVSYNVAPFLLQCLDSLLAALSGIESEVYVVDNHSRDDSVALVRKHHPEVIVVENHHNLGFSKANNIAIRQSKGEYVLLLNPDTIVASDTIAAAIQFLESHPHSGAAGVKMLNANGTVAPESRRGIPMPMTAFYKLSGLCGLFPNSRRFGRYYMGHLPWDSPQQIEIVSGAFCMISRKAIDKVGMLDEDYFMYGEDIDLSYRLLKGGFTNWYLPCRIIHYKGESTHKSSFRYVHVFYQAMLIFFRKHFSKLGILVTLPIQAAIAVKAFAALVSMLTEKMTKSLGFTTSNSSPVTADYICIGNEAMLSACRNITMKYGLKASFYSMAQKEKALTVAGEASQRTFIVFDPYAFSFSAMITIIGNMRNALVGIGTYQAATRSIITHTEVIQ